MRKNLNTKVRALDEAKSLLQTFGFNGFSFQHIADKLGIKKPSLYEHFKSKEELGRAIIADYNDKFTQWAETIEIFEPKEKVSAFFEIFFKFSNAGKFCQLSAMIADFNSIPKSMKKPLSDLFQFQYAWLKTVIKEGQKKKKFRRDFSSDELTEIVMSIGLGSQQMARVGANPKKIKEMKTQALKILEDH